MYKESELIITTSETIEVLRVINKLGIKEYLVSAIGKLAELEEENNNCYAKLHNILMQQCGGSEGYLKLSDEEKEEKTKLILSENIELNNKLTAIKRDQINAGGDLIMEFVTKLPNAEKEVYKCLSKIFEKDIKEIERQPIGETIEMIKLIAESKSVQAFFNLASK